LVAAVRPGTTNVKIFPTAVDVLYVTVGVVVVPYKRAYAMGALPVMPVVSIVTVMLFVVALTKAGTVGGPLGGVTAVGSVVNGVTVDCVSPTTFAAIATTLYVLFGDSPVSVVS